jgi:hypothetical protein
VISLLQKGQNNRIKNIVSVYYGIQCSLNNFDISATIMTNSSPDHNTSASKMVALSPDLSPIEHLWDELGRRVRHSQNPPETQQELHYAFVHEWNNIPQAFVQ